MFVIVGGMYMYVGVHACVHLNDYMCLCIYTWYALI